MDSGEQSVSVEPRSRTSQSRLHGMDAVRAGASILVILLHAAHAYIPNQMPGLVWPAHDSHPSVVVATLFWWIEGFIMPLFLWMSGFFAMGIVLRKGTHGFLKNRVDRILKPLLFAILVILPLDLYAWGIGFVLDGRASIRKLRSLKFAPEIDDKLWGLSHLWYLEYLFLYCIGLWCVYSLYRRGFARDAFAWAVSFLKVPANSVAVCLIACIGVLAWSPVTVIGFQHSFFPVPAKFLWSGAFFCGGACLSCAEDIGDRLRRTGPWLLSASLPPAVLMIALTGQHFRTGLTGAETMAYACGTSFFAWLTVLGLSGTALRFVAGESSIVAYVAEASFWTYLLHHPVVGFLQAILGLLALPAILKFAICSVVTASITLGSWKLLRTTRLGRMLGGPREEKTFRAETTQPELRRAA